MPDQLKPSEDYILSEYALAKQKAVNVDEPELKAVYEQYARVSEHAYRMLVSMGEARTEMLAAERAYGIKVKIDQTTGNLKIQKYRTPLPRKGQDEDESKRYRDIEED